MARSGDADELWHCVQTHHVAHPRGGPAMCFIEGARLRRSEIEAFSGGYWAREADGDTAVMRARLALSEPLADPNPPEPGEALTYFGVVKR